MKTNLVTPDEVAKALCVTTETLRAWVKAGVFPAPISLGPRAKRWNESDVENYLNARRIEAKRKKERF
ncbi:helix-turn-helix domain-containing protein [uncultured Rubinisphaera sp.]|uniref:helix-turn-helix transcriptional regulator n=1 Tax=uncultured Rubinisphaera sp. TaxID=1678686 RepID=UPI0030D93352|tara:strand:+ start:1029 stop:1232 length:204 start_codon:yes stop_codon:yes gene_type:complete